MSNTIKNILLAIILIAVVAVGLEFCLRPDPDEQPLEPNFKEKYDSLYELQSSQRMEMVRLIDSLTSSNQLLRTELDNTNKELESIPGRYDNHTPSELEIEMEKRALNK